MSRISFDILYSCFAGPSIYMGMRMLVMLLYVTLILWTGSLIWFYIFFMSRCSSTTRTNSRSRISLSTTGKLPRCVLLIITYNICNREFLRWMNRGNSHMHKNSWIGYYRLFHMIITATRRNASDSHPNVFQTTSPAQTGALCFSLR